MFTQLRQRKVILIFIGLGAAAAIGWKASERSRSLETEQLRIVDKNGRLRYTIDSCITSYDSTGRVKGVFH